MGIEFHLRPAVRSDAAAIRRLIRGARINPTGIDWRRFVVALDEKGAVIGCGQTKPHAGATLELASIVVARPWRGRGVARAVIEKLKQAAGPPLWLICRADLAGLYQRFGFRLVDPHESQPEAWTKARRRLRALSLLTGLKFAIMVWE